MKTELFINIYYCYSHRCICSCWYIINHKGFWF